MTQSTVSRLNVMASIQTVYVRGILLYQLYDLQHAAWYPLRLMAEATQTAFQNPFLPASYTRVGRTIAAGAELVAERAPAKVVITEYVRLTQAFFPDGREARFVNAVLDHMARDFKPDSLG